MSSLFDEMMEEICEKNQKITDLEAKLAESEADKKALICDYESRITKNHELMSWLEHKNEELKQQLFESGLKTLEEIKLSEQRKKMLEDLSTKNWELEKQLAEKKAEIEKWKSMAERSSNLLDRYNRTGEIEDQDKISFAVERFEQLKEWVHNTASYVLGDYASVYEDDLLDEIDNQINVLRNNKYV